MRRHSKFVSSLKQVEKRLKSEDQPPPKPQPALEIKETCGTDSPIFLHSNQPNNHSSMVEESSEVAPAFLSSSPPFPSTAHEEEDPSAQIRNPEKRVDFEEDPVEGMIQRLIELLGLSEEGKGRERGDEGLVSGCGCDCEGGFYSKIVGVEGPKCDKEAERLEGWIKHLMNGNGNEKMEPLRLAHLLLGKATQTQGSDFQFPSTVSELLQNDCPTN